MMQRIKKPVSILLSILMVLSLFTVVPIASASAAEITVTWTAADIKNAENDTFTINEVTLAAGAGDVDHGVPIIWNGGTFTTTLGNFTKIEISADYAGNVSGTGWSNDGWQSATWSGDAASVSFSGDIWGGGLTCDGDNLTIKFTIVSAPTYTYTLTCTDALVDAFDVNVTPQYFDVGEDNWDVYAEKGVAYTILSEPDDDEYAVAFSFKVPEGTSFNASDITVTMGDTALTLGEVSDFETDKDVVVGLTNYSTYSRYTYYIRKGELTDNLVVDYAPTEAPTEAPAAGASFVKVTSEPADWSGEYLVVYEVDGVPTKVFNSAANLSSGANALQDAFGVSDGNIDYDDTTAAATVTIAKIEDTGYYSIKVASGNYIGRTSDGNGLNESDSVLENTIAWDNGSVKITSAGGAIMRYNTTASQFRYYKSATYTNQQPIQLYKLTGGSAPAPTEPATEAAAPTESLEYTFVKVTSEPTDWSGEYLVVYEVDGEPNKVFNSAANLAVGANTLQAEFGVSDGNIDYDATTAAATVTIAKMEDTGCYSIKTASGKYIGKTDDANGLDESGSELENTIAWDNGSVKITSAGGAIMRYNTGASQFRYYKSATYTNQQPIQLYKLTAVEPETQPETQPVEAPEYADRLVEITDHETILIDLGFEPDMSEWGLSITFDEASALAHYMSAQNNGANCAVFYKVEDDYDLFYAISDGVSGDALSFYSYPLKDILAGYKVYYVSLTEPATEPETETSYTVTWKNWDGEELETDANVPQDTLPSYDGEAPTRPDDANSTYTFAAWDDGSTTYILGVDDLPPVTGDVTYTAVFTADPKATEAPTEAVEETFESLDLTSHVSGKQAQSFSGEHFSVTVDPDVSGYEGWTFDGDYPNRDVSIASLNGETITKVVVHRSRFSNDMILKANGQSIPYTKENESGEIVDFVYDNINASEVKLNANPDYGDNSCYCSVSSIDVYYTNAAPAPTEPETQPETTPAVEPGYYVVGTFTDTDWTIDPAYKLTDNLEAAAELMFLGLELTATDQLKVVHTTDGQTIDRWYPDGVGNSYGENGELTADGTYNIYFRPNADGGEDWFYNCIYVQPVETEPETEAPTEAKPQAGDVLPESDYLTFTAVEAGSSVNLDVDDGSNLKYNKNNSGWVSYDGHTEIALENEGDSVSFSGQDVIFNSSYHVTIDGKVACSGNVMSLRLSDGVIQGLSERCFECMFDGCTGLTTAPELPETALAPSCYGNMFDGCTSLTAAPELPATTLEANCYYGMFSGCESLTTAPELPATTLAESCYAYMFYGCKSLTAAPELPAKELATNCYSGMFTYCVKLSTAPELPATTLADYCYSGMFYGCESLSELPELPATTLATMCYYFMFGGCSKIYISDEAGTFDGITYSAEYRIPSSGTGESASNALYNMFDSTGGKFKGTPDINTTYYIPAPAVEPTEPATEPATEAPELPDVIKDCTYQNSDTQNVYANVPFIIGENYSEFPNGAILTDTDPDDNQKIIVYDAKGYSYHFYDKTGTEIPATLSGTSLIAGPDVGLSDDVTIYMKAFDPTYPEGFDPSINEIYIVATVPELPEVIKDCTYTLIYSDFVLHANVPLTADIEDMSALPSGSICAPEAAGGVVLFDAKGYTYKFYDITGAEIPLTLHSSTSMPGSEVGLSEDVTVYHPTYTGVPETCSDVYVVATVPTTFTVTWKNGETVLETDENVAEGTTPEYNGTTPVKDEDDDFTYTFAGWSPEIAAVTGDVTYTATFDPTAKYEAGYYIIGTMTQWKVNDAYMLTLNNQSDSTEYLFEDFSINMGDMFKVVYAEAGKDKIWYPEGMGNNYGENGEFTNGGYYTVYFRPNYDGGENWFYNCIYAVCTMTDAAMLVNGQINVLPEATDVTINDKDAVNAARQAYDALSDADKAFVDPALLQKLTDDEAAIAGLEAVAAVEALIDALPEQIALTDKNDVEAARQAYDALTDAQKNQIDADKLAKLTDAEAAIADLEAVAAVETLIDALPSEITLNDKQNVEAARQAYDALTDAQKDLVALPTLTLLTNAEEKIADLEAAAAVVALIDALPAAEDVALTDANDIIAARQAYDALTDAQKNLIDSETYMKLVDDELASQKIADDINAVSDVVTQIEDLPAATDVTLADKTDIDAARMAYDTMTDDQKAIFPEQVLQKLTEAEAKIADLEAAADVTNAINALPGEITLNDKQTVEAARAAYDALTDAQKDLVDADTLAKLTDAEQKIADLEAANAVNELIYDLPDETELDDKPDVEAARQAYDALTDDQKALVDEDLLGKLAAAEQTIANIEAANAVNELINDLPDEITLDDKADVEAARQAYDALTDDQKNLIDGETLNKLTAAETVIADREAAKAVEDMINALPDQITSENKQAFTDASSAFIRLSHAQEEYLSEEATNKINNVLLANYFVSGADLLPEEITLDDKQSVTDLRSYYDDANDDVKALISDEYMNKLVSAEQKIADLEAVKDVEDMISALPAVEDITLNDKDAVQAANDAFVALTNEQVMMLDGDLFDKLRDAAEKIADLEAAKDVEDTINALPGEITLNDKTDVEAARAAYDALTDAQKDLVDADTLAKLTDAEEAIADLEAAADVTDTINDLPENITLADKADVEAAREAYDALTDAQKDMVDADTLAKLTDAEEAIADLEAAADVTDTINDLPENITLADKADVEAARAAYDALTDAQKDLVDADTLQKLTKAEQSIDAIEDALEDLQEVLGVVMQIAALPDKDNVQYSDKDNIETVRAAYDALSDAQKAMISEDTYQKLTDAEAQLANFILLGDVDGNGEVETIDVTWIQRYLVMSTVCDPFIEAAGDIDGDGEVSAIDVTWLQRYLVSVDTPYPINEMVQPTV